MILIQSVVSLNDLASTRHNVQIPLSWELYNLDSSAIGLIGGVGGSWIVHCGYLLELLLVSWGRCLDYRVQPAIELPEPDLSAGYRILLIKALRETDPSQA